MSTRSVAAAALLFLAAHASTAAAGKRCTARGRVDDGKLVNTYEFDARGRIVSTSIKIIEDDGGSRGGGEDWSYDAAGRLASYRDQRGTEYRPSWDADGKLTTVRVGGTYEWQEVRFTWAAGAKAVAVPTHAPVRFAWLDRNDPRGRLSPFLFGGASGTASGAVFACTKAKCRETDKRSVSTYDDRGRLTGIKRDGVDTTIRYSDDGPVEMRENDAMLQVTTWSYERGRLVEVVTVTGNTRRAGTRISWSKTGPTQAVRFDGTTTEPPLVFQGCRF